MTLSIKNGKYAFLIKLDLIGVPIVTSFKRPIYQTFKTLKI